MHIAPRLALAGLLLCPGAVQARDEHESPRARAAADTSFSNCIYVREGAWLDEELDERSTRIAPGLFLLHLRRPTGAWVVESWYFRVAAEPRRAWTFEQMAHRIEATGAPAPAELGLVVDQVLVYANDAAQASRLACAMRRDDVPARVRQALAPGQERRGGAVP